MEFSVEIILAKTNPLQNKSIIDFMNHNAQDESDTENIEYLKNKEIHKNFKPKSIWKPRPPNKP